MLFRTSQYRCVCGVSARHPAAQVLVGSGEMYTSQDQPRAGRGCGSRPSWPSAPLHTELAEGHGDRAEGAGQGARAERAGRATGGRPGGLRASERVAGERTRDPARPRLPCVLSRRGRSHQTLSLARSHSHALIRTLSAARSRPHALDRTLSCARSRMHALVRTVCSFVRICV